MSDISVLMGELYTDADWSEVVPETERLDTSAHRAKGQLAQKAKRQPPSRSKLRETFGASPCPPEVSPGLPLSSRFPHSYTFYHSVSLPGVIVPLKVHYVDVCQRIIYKKDIILVT